jgi:carotenoid cleavage dioxygenase-like enzyme
VVAFTFDGSGRVRFTNKFVRTRGFLDEQVRGLVC